jgi:hypothetical protein
MKLPHSLLFATVFASAMAALWAADDKAPGAEIFDFSDLDVVEKPGSSKPAEPKKDTPPPHRKALPPDAAALVLRLVKYEDIRASALEDKVTELRKGVAQKLTASAARADGSARTKLEEASKRCLTTAPLERLAHPVAASALPVASTWSLKGGASPRTLELGGKLLIGEQQRGNWFWVDETKGIAVYDWWGGDDCDLMRLTPAGTADTLSNRGVSGQLFRVENAATKSAAFEAASVLATTAMQERLWFNFIEADCTSKRKRVHDWLIVQARTAQGEANTALLKEAAAMEFVRIPGLGKREQPERVEGTWVSKKGQRFRFLPEGVVAVDENLAAGTWRWAKVKNWRTMLVALPAMAPTEFFFARLPRDEPGVLRTCAFGSPESVLTKEKEDPAKF